jgi:hypothetical protein
MVDVGKKHRVIGIRYALRPFKEAGLAEEESFYPRDAVKDAQAKGLSIAERWYEIGAKRGARKILEAFLEGHFEITTDKDGKREIVANVDSVKWTKPLNVTIGNEKQQVPKRTYELTLKDLEFDV